MTAPNKPTMYLLKTRPPFNVVLLGLIILFLTVESFFNPVWIIYSIPLYPMFYVQFCRYCCVVSITKQNLNVYYFAPWNKNIEIKIGDIKKIEYLTGFYNYTILSTKRLGGLHTFPKYCYDRLIINLNDSENSIIQVDINTRIFEFRKILKVLIALNLLDKNY